MPEATFAALLAAATKALGFDTVSAKAPVMVVGAGGAEHEQF